MAIKPTNPSACEAWELLLKFFFSQRADLPAIAAEFELSPAQCLVLHLLEPGHPIAMSQLAETLACDKSNVTGLVDRLESRGLIRRQASEEDRRLKVLDLTPAGARLRAVVLEKMSDPPKTLKELSHAEQQQLVRILRHLLEGEEE